MVGEHRNRGKGLFPMVTDLQVRRLFRLSLMEPNQEIAALKVGMDPKTARKWLRLRQLPSEQKRG